MTYSSGDDRTVVIVTKMCVEHEFFIKSLNLRAHTCTQVSCTWLQSSPASDWLMWWLRDRAELQGCFCSFAAQPSIFILQQLVHCPLTNMFNSWQSGADLLTEWICNGLHFGLWVEQKLSFQITFLHLADVFPGTKMATITEKMYALSTKKRSLHFCNFVVSAKEWRI